MVYVGVGMDVVSLAAIVTVEGGSERTGGGVNEIATAVKVVDLEAQAGILIDICCKIGSDTVFAVDFATHGMISQIGPGAQCIGEAELAQSPLK